MEMNGKYQTSDLYLAAYLLSIGLQLLDVDHRDPIMALRTLANYRDLGIYSQPKYGKS